MKCEIELKSKFTKQNQKQREKTFAEFLLNASAIFKQAEKNDEELVKLVESNKALDNRNYFVGKHLSP